MRGEKTDEGRVGGDVSYNTIQLMINDHFLIIKQYLVYQTKAKSYEMKTDENGNAEPIK